MKSLFLSLTLLTTLPVLPAPAQDLKMNLKSTDHAVESDHVKKTKPNHEAKKKEVVQIDTLSENYQMLLEEYYKLPDNTAKNFVHTPDGKDYTGTKNGIIVWDGSTITITTENSNIPEDNISALALDHENQMWIGTYSAGIVIGIGVCIKPYKIKHVQTHDQNVDSIEVDEKGHVWVTYRNKGIECFQDGISMAYYPAK